MKNILKKLLEVQKEIGSIKKESVNPFYKSTYFDINALLSQIKPILNKNGLVLFQPLTNQDGKWALATNISDVESGESIRDIVILPEVLDPQKAGSAITYFRRYALQSLLALEAEDDDGNSASIKVKDKSSYKPKVDTSAPPF